MKSYFFFQLKLHLIFIGRLHTLHFPDYLILVLIKLCNCQSEEACPNQSQIEPIIKTRLLQNKEKLDIT